jgi:hypothetical protein
VLAVDEAFLEIGFTVTALLCVGMGYVWLRLLGRPLGKRLLKAETFTKREPSDRMVRSLRVNAIILMLAGAFAFIYSVIQLFRDN